MRNKRILAALISLMLILSGCGARETAAAPRLIEQRDEAVPAAAYAAAKRYQAPAFADSSFHGAWADSGEPAKIDLSETELGYLAVSAVSGSRLKFQVIKGETTYTYDMASDGTPSVFPLQSGDGTYTVRVMENVVDTRYAEFYSTTCDVKLRDEFQPFIRPSSYVSYTPDSECVKKAAELAADAETAMDVVRAIYGFICAAVSYDHEKAQTVRSGYLPYPDETLDTGMGICFDYASLAAAMLRSQGIPAKLIFGYVSPNDLYHAWNMFYTGETGWVTVSYEVREDSWNRLDLTFSANGADDSFVGDGGNYAEVYFY